jgi:hypothetical protein
MCKQFDGLMRYGRSNYDFDEGSFMFTAPNQIISSSPDLHVNEGWGLFFHPNLLNGTSLAGKIQNYSFFHYDSNEALHISDVEKVTLMDRLVTIKKDYSQNINRHTKELIVDNLQLMLTYCRRLNQKYLSSGM